MPISSDRHPPSSIIVIIPFAGLLLTYKPDYCMSTGLARTNLRIMDPNIVENPYYRAHVHVLQETASGLGRRAGGGPGDTRVAFPAVPFRPVLGRAQRLPPEILAHRSTHNIHNFHLKEYSRRLKLARL